MGATPLPIQYFLKISRILGWLISQGLDGAGPLWGDGGGAGASDGCAGPHTHPAALAWINVHIGIVSFYNDIEREKGDF